jgi:hypothetical protein
LAIWRARRSSGVGGLDLGGQALDGGVIAATGCTVAGDGVDDAPGQATGADAEPDEAHEHEQGQAEVDNLDGAAPSAAAEIEQHGSCGLVLIAGDVHWLRG